MLPVYWWSIAPSDKLLYFTSCEDMICTEILAVAGSFSIRPLLPAIFHRWIPMSSNTPVGFIFAWLVKLHLLLQLQCLYNLCGRCMFQYGALANWYHSTTNTTLSSLPILSIIGDTFGYHRSISFVPSLRGELLCWIYWPVLPELVIYSFLYACDIGNDTANSPSQVHFSTWSHL